MYLLLLQNPVQIVGVGAALFLIAGNGAGSVGTPQPGPPDPSIPGWIINPPTPAIWTAEVF